MRTRRSYLWFSVVAVFSCVLVGQSHADDEAIRKKASESVERMSRSEFEVAMRRLEQKAKEKGFTSSDLENARNGFKVLFYNKAYNYYLCITQDGGQHPAMHGVRRPGGRQLAWRSS